MQHFPRPRGLAPRASATIMYLFCICVLDVILTRMLDVILMHTLDVLIRMHILNVLLLVLATTVLAICFWELLCCNNDAEAQV